MTNYIHGRNYIYDATTQTFDVAVFPTATLQQVSDSFDKVIADGFSFYASFYGSKWHVTLNKRTFGENSVTLDVKGDGETIFEAVERALNNFPKNPLDGSRWKNDRLAPPAEDATFTELSDQERQP